MADGFLGRWSQRKQAVREGRPGAEPPLPPLPGSAANVAGVATPDHLVVGVGEGAPAARSNRPDECSAIRRGVDSGAASAPQALPPPTLEDVKALNADSSYAPFVSRNVAPDVRNAAMKKLFTDPHYNVMDGLDIYIDDYSLPSPMPAAMLRQMVSAKFLNLFDDEPASTPAPSLAQIPAPTSTPATPIEDTPHDHTDLRLQPDHAARPEGPEREPERTLDAAFQPVPPRGS